MTQFTTRVSSGGMLNIPQHTEDMEDFEKNDLLTLEVVKHKKADGTVVTDETENETEVAEQ